LGGGALSGEGKNQRGKVARTTWRKKGVQGRTYSLPDGNGYRVKGKLTQLRDRDIVKRQKIAKDVANAQQTTATRHARCLPHKVSGAKKKMQATSGTSESKFPPFRGENLASFGTRAEGRKDVVRKIHSGRERLRGASKRQTYIHQRRISKEKRKISLNNKNL